MEGEKEKGQNINSAFACFNQLKKTSRFFK
jgi:hypothetical protein